MVNPNDISIDSFGSLFKDFIGKRNDGPSDKSEMLIEQYQTIFSDPLDSICNSKVMNIDPNQTELIPRNESSPKSTNKTSTRKKNPPKKRKQNEVEKTRKRIKKNDDEKSKQRRESQVRASRRYRKRKKEHIQEMERRIEELKGENSRLKDQNNLLKTKIINNNETLDESNEIDNVVSELRELTKSMNMNIEITDIQKNQLKQLKQQYLSSVYKIYVERGTIIDEILNFYNNKLIDKEDIILG